jgi:multiple antibiotic resistance protein
MTLFSVTMVLFLIMDPFGNIATFLKILGNVPEKKRQRLILAREMAIALATMLFFLFVGRMVMGVLNVTPTTIRIASGMIMFLAALQILFPNINSLRLQIQKGSQSGEEPFVVPLAIPLTASPSLLATIILYSHLEPSEPIMLAAVLIAWAFTTAILFFGKLFHRILTTNGLIACEKLMGMILILLAIQRFLEGIQCFVGLCTA